MSFKPIVIICFLLGCNSLLAQDFVYQPINPAFGGSYLNYSWLLNSAQAQNSYTAKEDDLSRRLQRDPLQEFEQSLNRQVLSQITRRLVDNQFGENGLEEGEYEIGNYSIEVVALGEGVQITIQDISTGSTTTVSVPYF